MFNLDIIEGNTGEVDEHDIDHALEKLSDELLRERRDAFGDVFKPKTWNQLWRGQR